jgi:hypothetical protein
MWWPGDISVECFVRNLYNQETPAVIFRRGYKEEGYEGCHELH